MNIFIKGLFCSAFLSGLCTKVNAEIEKIGMCPSVNEIFKRDENINDKEIINDKLKFEFSGSMELTSVSINSSIAKTFIDWIVCDYTNKDSSGKVNYVFRLTTHFPTEYDKETCRFSDGKNLKHYRYACHPNDKQENCVIMCRKK